MKDDIPVVLTPEIYLIKIQSPSEAKHNTATYEASIAPSSKSKITLGDRAIENRILKLLNDGKKLAAKAMRALDRSLSSVSPQRMGVILRNMVRKGSVIKAREDGYYYATEALYDNTVNAFHRAKTVAAFIDLSVKFDLLGEYKSARSYAERCYERSREIDYDTAAQMMFSAKTPDDFKTAANIFRRLGSFRESKAYLNFCEERGLELENFSAYNAAVKKMNGAKSSAAVSRVVPLFEALDSYRDSKALAAKCKEKVTVLKEEERKQSIYDQAIARIMSTNTALLTQSAAELDAISGWRDADIQAQLIRVRISDLLIEEERVRIAEKKKEKKIKTIAIVVTLLLLVGLGSAALVHALFIPMYKMNQAEQLLEVGIYFGAQDLYEEMNGYGDIRVNNLQVQGVAVCVMHSMYFEELSKLVVSMNHIYRIYDFGVSKKAYTICPTLTAHMETCRHERVPITRSSVVGS